MLLKLSDHRGNVLLQIVVTGMPHHGFGLALYHDTLYWTDWVLRAVVAANKYTGGDIHYLKKDILRQPMGIVAIATDASTCTYHCVFLSRGRMHDIPIAYRHVSA